MVKTLLDGSPAIVEAGWVTIDPHGAVGGDSVEADSGGEIGAIISEVKVEGIGADVIEHGNKSATWYLPPQILDVLSCEEAFAGGVDGEVRRRGSDGCVSELIAPDGQKGC